MVITSKRRMLVSSMQTTSLILSLGFTSGSTHLRATKATCLSALEEGILSNFESIAFSIFPLEIIDLNQSTILDCNLESC